MFYAFNPSYFVHKYFCLSIFQIFQNSIRLLNPAC